MNRHRVLFVCISFGLLAILLSACAAQKPNRPNQGSPQANAQDKQIKIGSFDVPGSPAPGSTAPPTPQKTPQSTAINTPLPTSNCNPTPLPALPQPQRYCDRFLESYVPIKTNLSNNCECIQAGSQSLYEETVTCRNGRSPHYNSVCLDNNIQCGVVTFCHGKPVVYLYPEKPTLVDVSVATPGKIIASDPAYPNGGWPNVLAYPDGTLVYQGTTFPYLYYETALDHVKAPQTGQIVATANLGSTLLGLTQQYGLSAKESQQFVQYWLPKLTAYHKPYVQVSFLDPIEKNRVDHITLAPEPTTRIELSAYFVLLDKPKTIAPLVIPKQPPVRTGFTMVEWGGIVEPYTGKTAPANISDLLQYLLK